LFGINGHRYYTYRALEWIILEYDSQPNLQAAKLRSHDCDRALV
jgi:hypothetical protein